MDIQVFAYNLELDPGLSWAYCCDIEYHYLHAINITEVGREAISRSDWKDGLR